MNKLMKAEIVSRKVLSWLGAGGRGSTSQNLSAVVPQFHSGWKTIVKVNPLVEQSTWSLLLWFE
jgi:hypothetical protein